MRQLEKWGDQTHSFDEWVLILMEEIGEFSQKILEQRYQKKYTAVDIRQELVQIVAVALAMLEDFDR